MNIYDPVFSSSQVAKAAGMTYANFRAYLARESTGWRPIGDMHAKAAERNGEGHSFSIYDALGYALAADLVRHGVDPKDAFKRGMLDFAHSGGDEWDGASGFAKRDPGNVFDPGTYGRTIFAYALGEGRGQCLPLKTLAGPSNLFFTPDRRHAASVILIDLNKLRDRTFNALGLDARDYD